MIFHPDVLYDVSGMECVPPGTKQQEVMLESGTTNELRQSSDTGVRIENGDNCNKESGWWVYYHTVFYNGLKFIYNCIFSALKFDYSML